MKVKWGKAGGPGDLLKPRRPLEVQQDEVNGPVDALLIGKRFALPFFWSVSQDL